MRTPPAPVPAAEPVANSAPESEAAARAPLPTLEDAARLTPDADFSAFVAKGVDQSVRRLALKKLFADPNFAVMDGLDIYIADYNKAAPLTDAMLASLRHAPGVLNRLLGEDEDQQAEVQARRDDDPAAEGQPGTPTQGNT